MTVTANAPAGVPAERPADLVTVTVDGVDVAVPKGTLVIRAAELLGVEIPRFCDHPLLEPVAACRMCLVEIEGMPKPQPSCAVTVTDGMVVKTQHTSAMAEGAQQGVMEFLLVNHPLDCPICDKGGECPLQNQAMSAGRPESRFDGTKRTFPKPINISAQILLDRERCVSCARCTRFAEQIAGDPFIELLERGAKQQVGISADTPFDSYFSGNTVQICPVGALTSALYRFRARPFDLVSVPTTCEHCASGCALRTDYRRSTVTRRLAWDDPEVNEEWNCDKGRFAFAYLERDRLTHPLVREDGQLRPASWPEALDVAARGLAAARGRAGVLAGGRLTLEDALAYSRFARVALGSDDVDFRARPMSHEESEFLAAHVAGRPLGPTYADLERAPFVLLVAFEPEDESPIVFLRLRKAVRRGGTRVVTLAAVRSRGTDKLAAAWWAVQPGAEAGILRRLADGVLDEQGGLDSDVLAGLREPGAVILVGERVAGIDGGPTAVAALARATGAALAWIPRRAGERGALDAGLLPGLLPGGRPLAEPVARQEVAAAWGVPAEALPDAPGRGASALVRDLLADAAAAAEPVPDGEEAPERSVAALVVAGVDPEDFSAPSQVRAALDAVPFLVSLESRHTDVTERADVVLPVAVVTEKAGTFVDWEGRPRPFSAVMRDSSALSDARVLAMLADAMDVPAGAGDVAALRAQAAALGAWSGARAGEPSTPPAQVTLPDGDGFLLASWRELIDRGRLQEGEPYLATTARARVARIGSANAAQLGLADGDLVTVTGPAGSVTLPVEVGDVVDRTVWLPGNAEDCAIHRDLGVDAGDVVRIARGGSA